MEKANIKPNINMKTRYQFININYNIKIEKQKK